MLLSFIMHHPGDMSLCCTVVVHDGHMEESGDGSDAKPDFGEQEHMMI